MQSFSYNREHERNSGHVSLYITVTFYFFIYFNDLAKICILSAISEYAPSSPGHVTQGRSFQKPSYIPRPTNHENDLDSSVPEVLVKTPFPVLIISLPLKGLPITLRKLMIKYNNLSNYVQWCSCRARATHQRSTTSCCSDLGLKRKKKNHLVDCTDI